MGAADRRVHIDAIHGPMSHQIDTLLDESRHYPVPAEFAAQANVADESLFAAAKADPIAFWEEQAKALTWDKPWDTALEWNLPYAKWFIGGKLNACYNCVDRHVEAGLGDRIAFICEEEPGRVTRYTYSQVQREVSRLANGLKKLGVQKGDRVCIYMPMLAELCFAMLACARIGAAHSVIFGGFSPESIAERCNDAGAKLIITADGGWRRGKVIELKRMVDEALALGCPTVKNVLVHNRMADQEASFNSGSWNPERDLWWHELLADVSDVCPCESMDSEDLLYILYTSGSTGKPKGIMHTTGGYLTGVNCTTRWVFDLKPSDIYWCTADAGWVTGHSYVVYGPMSNAATIVIYEGAPDTPEKDRFWRIIERHKVTILYTAPTAIRTFMKWGTEYITPVDLSSLRLLGSVGEPINPEAWVWYNEHIGGKRCPIVDTWWQTETGAIMISPLPGLTNTKPGSATRPLPGVEISILDDEGKVLDTLTGDRAPGEQPVGGILTLNKPWPSMLRGIWGDPDRYEKTYWSRFEGRYFPGDGVKLDEEGYLFLLGRVDDIMLVAGHNISTMEVESALVDHHSVAEAAVIGKTHDVKGQSVFAFVILKRGVEESEALIAELKAHVAQKIGALARPDDLILTAELPKTRSGKIMRRLLRDIAEGRALGDTTTLNDPNVIATLKAEYESVEG